MSILWLILVMALWGLVHSLLATLAFKDFLRRLLGNGLLRFYRLFYNIFAVSSFGPVLYLMAILPDRPLYEVASPWKYLMLTGQGMAVILLVASMLQTDALSFVGLRQLFEEENRGQLIIHGFYRYIRHPLYTFGLLFLWLSPSVTQNSLVVYLSSTIYIVVGAYFEERKLLREFGKAYADYQKVTPMLIPVWKFSGNKS